MLDLRRLEHLIALDDERHFGRAARRAHLSQPAFSRSIQALERDLGQRLFDREGGEIRPTPAGAFLIERTRRMLFDARALERDLRLYADARLGDTAFGVGPFPAATLLPRVLTGLRRSHPDVHLRVEVSNWQLLLRRLHAEDIEFFVAERRDVPADAALRIRPLARQVGGFYVRAGHPLLDRACTVAECFRYGVVSTRLPPALKATYAARLGLPRGTEPPLALECDDVALLREVALGTDSVAALTHASARGDVTAGRLRELRVDDLPPGYSEMGVVSLRGWTLSPMAALAMARITAAAREIGREQG